MREGVRTAKIAVYIGDMIKYRRRRERDRDISKARRDLDWEKQFSLALFPEDARASVRPQPEAEQTCTMCGEFCASRGANTLFPGYLRGDKR